MEDQQASETLRSLAAVRGWVRLTLDQGWFSSLMFGTAVIAGIVLSYRSRTLSGVLLVWVGVLAVASVAVWARCHWAEQSLGVRYGSAVWLTPLVVGLTALLVWWLGVVLGVTLVAALGPPAVVSANFVWVGIRGRALTLACVGVALFACAGVVYVLRLEQLAPVPMALYGLTMLFFGTDAARRITTVS